MAIASETFIFASCTPSLFKNITITIDRLLKGGRSCGGWTIPSCVVDSS